MVGRWPMAVYRGSYIVNHNFINDNDKKALGVRR